MDERKFFDAKGFGQWLKEERKMAGYKSAGAFAEAVSRLTGYEITRDIVYKLEQGRQDITVKQMLAFSLAIYSYRGVCETATSQLWNAAGAYIDDRALAVEHAGMYLAAEEMAEEYKKALADMLQHVPVDADIAEQKLIIRIGERPLKAAEKRKHAAGQRLLDIGLDVSAAIAAWKTQYEKNNCVPSDLYDELSGGYDN